MPHTHLMFNCFLVCHGWVGRIEHARKFKGPPLSQFGEFVPLYLEFGACLGPTRFITEGFPQSIYILHCISAYILCFPNLARTLLFQLENLPYVSTSHINIKLIQVSLLLCKSYCSSAVWNAINSCAGQRVRFTRFLILFLCAQTALHNN